MPLLWDEMPELTLDVIGANPTLRCATSSNRAWTSSGSFPTLPSASPPRASTCTLFATERIKLKLIDTMAAGLPFVTTPIGAEGLGLGDLEDLVVADDDRELARLALELYRDRDLWQHVQHRLLALVGAVSAVRRSARRSSRRSRIGVAPPPSAAQERPLRTK